jgi:hypothetical protein
MLLMSSFSVVDAKGGEVVGTKAINFIKHQTPPIKKLFFKVVLVLWSKIGSK